MGVTTKKNTTKINSQEVRIDVPADKWCVGCGRVLPSSEFGYQIRDGVAVGYSGLKGRCRSCAAKFKRLKKSGGEIPHFPPPPAEQLEKLLTPFTPAEPPSPPLRVTATVGDAKVKLTWEPPKEPQAKVDKWLVFRNGSLYATCPGTQNTWVDTKVKNNERYVYALKAFGPGGESSLSEAVIAVPFGVPAKVAAVTVDLDDRSVTVNWEPVPSVAQEKVTYEVDYGNETVKKNVTSGPVKATMPPGSHLNIRVRAVNQVGKGPWSEPVTVSVPTERIVPEPPTNLKPALDGTTLVVTWKPAPGQVTGYEIECRPAPPGSSPAKTVPRHLTQTSFPGLIPGKKYSVTIRSLHGHVRSEPVTSEPVMVPVKKTEPSPVDHPPLLLAALARLVHDYSAVPHAILGRWNREHAQKYEQEKQAAASAEDNIQERQASRTEPNLQPPRSLAS